MEIRSVPKTQASALSACSSRNSVNTQHQYKRAFAENQGLFERGFQLGREAFIFGQSLEKAHTISACEGK
jgi:hypothetical protein